MTAPNELLTSQTFAARAGVSASTVSKWLKSGKVKGVKQSGKWMISADQLTIVAPTHPQAPPAAPVTAKPVSMNAKPAPASRGYSIDEFSALTYLTAYGVERFLKEGRLSGRKDEAGKWIVDPANMDRPDIQRLLRK